MRPVWAWCGKRAHTPATCPHAHIRLPSWSACWRSCSDGCWVACKPHVCLICVFVHTVPQAWGGAGLASPHSAAPEEPSYWIWGIEPVLRLLRCSNHLIARVALLLVFRGLEAAVALGRMADLASVLSSVLPASRWGPVFVLRAAPSGGAAPTSRPTALPPHTFLALCGVLFFSLHVEADVHTFCCVWLCVAACACVCLRVPACACVWLYVPVCALCVPSPHAPTQRAVVRPGP